MPMHYELCSVRGFPMVPLVTNDNASGTIVITIGTNGFTNGTRTILVYHW